MFRSKNQAVYSYLPEIWVSDNTNSGRTITAKIDNWNWRNMSGIYENFIVGEIKRQIRMFGDRGGDITSYDISPEKHSLIIVEAATNEGVADIRGTISPLVFYCGSCGSVFSLRNADSVYGKNIWQCQKCNKYSVKQLQMIYACECGHAEPIKIPYVPGVSEFKYRPTETAYKMFYRQGNAEKAAEFFLPCTTCGARLRPDNATANRNFRPFTLRIINLVDQRNGMFYEKGLEAQKTVIARWFGKISSDVFNDILNNIELAFSDELRSNAKRKAIELQVQSLIDAKMISPDRFEEFVEKMLGADTNERSVEKYVAACDELFGKRKNKNIVEYNEWINYFSFKLMQYNTLKDTKRIISLDDAIAKEIELEFIDNADEVYRLNDKMGIANMQVSCDVQIVNCTYGFSRRAADPKKSTNRNCRLKMNSFSKNREGTATLVYGSKLDTEGILFEISQAKIIEWLYRNGIISKEQLPADDEQSIKKWFAEYVHAEHISMFGDIDGQDIITKNVFALLHSISHAFIKTAGELSGLASNSLMEIILIETASIFIYAQSGQGITLGALSGMVESNYVGFLKKAYVDNHNCVFDPICSERDDTACSACLVIPEVSCNYYNAELGRKYLYSLDETGNLPVGYWEMD